MIRALKIMTLSIMLFSFAAPSYAATLLSNFAQGINGAFGGNPDSADHFTTGTSPLTITDINLDWGGADTGAVHQVGIYTDNAGLPSGTLVGTFFTNVNPTVVGIMTYSGNVVLAPSTTYWMVIDISDNAVINYVFDTAFTAHPTTNGAVMLPDAAYGDNIAGGWMIDGAAPIPASLKFELIGTAAAIGAASIPALSFWGLGLLALLLGFISISLRHRFE